MVLGEEHPHTLSNITNLAHTLYAQNQKDKAKQLMANIVKCRTQKIGADYPDTLNSISIFSVWNND